MVLPLMVVGAVPDALPWPPEIAKRFRGLSLPRHLKDVRDSIPEMLRISRDRTCSACHGAKQAHGTRLPTSNWSGRQAASPPDAAFRGHLDGGRFRFVVRLVSPRPTEAPHLSAGR